MVKSAIVEVDFTPFRNWYEIHYNKKFSTAKPGSKEAHKPQATTQVKSEVKTDQEPEEVVKKGASDPGTLDEYFVKAASGLKVLGMQPAFTVSSMRFVIYAHPFIIKARITSRPGQSGRADGCLLEGKELDFYTRRLRLKK